MVRRGGTGRASTCLTPRGLELLAKELGEATIETVYFREQATIVVQPAEIRAVLQKLRAQGYGFLASVHGVDHYPEEPRLGVVYELLDMSRVDRVTVKVRVPARRAARGVGDGATGRRPTIRSARCMTCSGSCSRATRTCAGS